MAIIYRRPAFLPLSAVRRLSDDCQVLLEILVYVVAIVVVVLLGRLVDGNLGRRAENRVTVDAGQQQDGPPPL